MPPEFLRGGQYTEAGDVWQLGIVLFQMITLGFPYIGLNAKDILNNIVNFKFENAFKDISDDYKLFKQVIPKILCIGKQ